MDHRTHERGVGMLNTPYVKKDTIKNYFPLPNAIFDRQDEDRRGDRPDKVGD